MVRVAVIGGGSFGQVHLQTLSKIEGVEIVGVADQDAKRAQEAAQHAGIQHWTDNPHALLTRADVDAVVISTATDSHARLGIAAAQAGKHLLVEKPMALTVADADALITACHEAGVTLFVNQTARFHPINAALKEAVEAGELGRPVLLRLAWYHGLFWGDGWRAWQVHEQCSGGFIVHIGVHAIDLALWLFGEPVRSVYAQGLRSASPSMDIHDAFHVVLRFASGSMAVCEAGYTLPTPGGAYRRIALYGDRSAAYHRLDDDGLLYTEGTVRFPFQGPGPDLERAVRQWIKSLETGQEPPVKAVDAREALRVALAGAESLRTGRAVELEAGP